jgi:hypothetical protein
MVDTWRQCNIDDFPRQWLTWDLSFLSFFLFVFLFCGLFGGLVPSTFPFSRFAGPNADVAEPDSALHVRYSRGYAPYCEK